MRLYLIVFVCLLSSIAVSQPKDPGGWLGAKWGMTEAQVTKVLPSAKEPEDVTTRGDGNSYNGLEIKDFQLAGGEFDVLFWFEKPSKKLGSITITLIGKKESNPYIMTSLYGLLSSKYGPQATKEGGMAVWAIGTTMITLSALTSNSTSLGIQLEYRSLPKEDLAKL